MDIMELRQKKKSDICCPSSENTHMSTNNTDVNLLEWLIDLTAIAEVAPSFTFPHHLKRILSH